MPKTQFFITFFISRSYDAKKISIWSMFAVCHFCTKNCHMTMSTAQALLLLGFRVAKLSELEPGVVSLIGGVENHIANGLNTASGVKGLPYIRK